ncbi:hypothetical protein B0T24DRAFT_697051, partial [Lasiosphaeria ovina]
PRPQGSRPPGHRRSGQHPLGQSLREPARCYERTPTPITTTMTTPNNTHPALPISAPNQHSPFSTRLDGKETSKSERKTTRKCLARSAMTIRVFRAAASRCLCAHARKMKWKTTSQTTLYIQQTIFYRKPCDFGNNFGAERQGYNLNAFLFKLTSDGTPNHVIMNTRRLGEALINPSIRDALKVQGIELESRDEAMGKKTERS